jgi:amidohydrolase
MPFDAVPPRAGEPARPATWTTPDEARLLRQLELELAAVAPLRHAVHEDPHCSGEEGPTLDLVLEWMPASGRVQPTAGQGAVVRVGGAGPSVAARAELDALPLTEQTGLAWTSRNPGVMHACGHDVHLAALVALARAVAAVGGPAPLVAVLQPREEGYPSGAKDVRDSAVLQAEEVTAVIGAHVQPILPRSTVACTPGSVNASADEFVITVKGQGGHAAYPHRTSDPALALCQVVVALQTLVSRRLNPLHGGVISVTMINGGTAPNVIPEQVTARGTIRAMTVLARSTLHEGLRELSAAVAQAFGCHAEVQIVAGEPVLVNDKDLARATQQRLRELGATVDDSLRSAGSDDFSYFSDMMPGLMMFVGTGNGQETLHSPSFAPDDSVIGDVARALLAAYLAAAARVGPRGAVSS